MASSTSRSTQNSTQGAVKAAEPSTKKQVNLCTSSYTSLTQLILPSQTVEVVRCLLRCVLDATSK